MISRRALLRSIAAIGGALGAERGVAAAAAGAVSAKGPSPAKKLGGKVVYKGSAGYEQIRQFGIFNALKPERFPEAIVMAETQADVVAAVKLAKARGWQVGVRSGGHSWVAQHTRNGSLLINLARMQEISIDPARRLARVSPAVEGQVLNTVLQDQHKLMFPSAHGVGVGLGGFVLCGGHGWNSRVWGPGCANLVAVDVVNADGELVHADENHNSDYLWAARGAGPGYFAAAVRYHLRVHAMPQVMKRSVYVFPIQVLEELATWVRDNANAFPKFLEVVLIGRAANGAPDIIMSATALADSHAEVDTALDLLDSCPVSARATTRRLKMPTMVPYRYEQPTEGQPAGYRFAVDNIWTSAPSRQLVPLMRQLFTDFPTPKSYVFWQCWGPVQDLKNMAYSVQGDIYLAANAVYMDPVDDQRCGAWTVAAMKRLDAISLGAQMNDDDMVNHPARYLSAEASMRLESLRAKYDPEHRFVSFLRS